MTRNHLLIKVHEPRGVQVQGSSTSLPINALNCRSTHQVAAKSLSIIRHKMVILQTSMLA